MDLVNGVVVKEWYSMEFPNDDPEDNSVFRKEIRFNIRAFMRFMGDVIEDVQKEFSLGCIDVWFTPWGEKCMIRDTKKYFDGLGNLADVCLISSWHISGIEVRVKIYHAMDDDVFKFQFITRSGEKGSKFTVKNGEVHRDI